MTATSKELREIAQKIDKVFLESNINKGQEIALLEVIKFTIILSGENPIVSIIDKAEPV